MGYHCQLHLVMLNQKENPQVTTPSLSHGFFHQWPAMSSNKLSLSQSWLTGSFGGLKLQEPHLPQITVKPNSMSKGIQSVFNHHSKRREGGRPALFEHPLNGLPAPPSQTEASSHTHINMHSVSNAYSIKSTHSHMLTSKHTFYTHSHQPW